MKDTYGKLIQSLDSIESHLKNHETLIKKLTDQKILPLLEDVNSLYVHKGRINYKNSLLLTRDKLNKSYDIYELTHDEQSDQKIILGTGKDATVREAMETKTGEPVAVKIYPLDEKKGTPHPFSIENIRIEINQWNLSQEINKKVPGTFVELKHFCLAGDKRTGFDSSKRLIYVITKKYNTTLDKILNDKQISFETVQAIFTKLFIKHRRLYLNGYLYSDANFCNVLLDDKLEPIFCDPIALTKISPVSGGSLGLYLGICFSLNNFFLSQLEHAEAEENAVSSCVGHFLKELEDYLTDRNIKENAIELAVQQLLQEFSAIKNQKQVTHSEKEILSLDNQEVDNTTEGNENRSEWKCMR